MPSVSLSAHGVRPFLSAHVLCVFPGGTLGSGEKTFCSVLKSPSGPELLCEHAVGEKKHRIATQFGLLESIRSNCFFLVQRFFWSNDSRAVHTNRINTKVPPTDYLIRLLRTRVSSRRIIGYSTHPKAVYNPPERHAHTPPPQLCRARIPQLRMGNGDST